MGRITAAAVILTLLAGCAGPAIQYEHFETTRWQADGKLGAKYPHCNEYRGCRDEAINASYIWTHQEHDDRLQLFDPTGQERLKLVYRGNHVQLTEGGKTEDVSVNELEQRLGLVLPINELDTWLTQQRSSDDNEWDSDGWHIRVSDWQGHFYRKLTLTQDDVRLRLVTYNVKPN